MNQQVLNIANNTNIPVTYKQNYHNQQQNHPYQQQQQQQFNLQEEKAIILYYVYEDCQNFLNLLYSYQAVKEHYKKDPQNILVSICYNKLLTQMNLSNSIHYDLYINQKNPDLKAFLTKTKQDLKSKIKSAYPTEFNEEIQFYEQYCLNDVVINKQKQLKEIQLKVNFNDRVLQQIIPQIQSVDNKLNQIRQTQNYLTPTIEDMKSKALQYKQETFVKLKNQSSQNQKI